MHGGGLRARLLQWVSIGLYMSGSLGILRWLASVCMPLRNQRQEPVFPFVQVRRNANLQILTYHRVNDEQDALFPATPVKAFEQQMAHLAKHYHVCVLDEAVEEFQKGRLSRNAVVITFDDGYRDNYQYAYPIVKALSVPMTIFLATDVIGTGRTLWHDRVFSAFRDTAKPILDGFDSLTDGMKLAGPVDRQRTMERVLGLLRHLDEASRDARITALCSCLDVAERRVEQGLMLSWEEVREMSRHGVSFGSHTASHPIMSRISSQETDVQLEQSCEAIQRHLGSRPTTFAYPNGTKADFTEMTKQALRRHGFHCAVTTEFGINEPGTDLYELKRARPWELDLPTFALKMGWYRLISSHAA